MADLIQNKCTNCGGELDLSLSKGGTIRCKYCNSVFTLPKGKSLPDTLEFLKKGEEYLDTRHFDDAYTMYKKASEKSPDEPEAYFGMALATAQVQYLKDFRADGKTQTNSADFRMQPICYEISDKKFTEDKNYLKAIELATPEQQTAYREKGEEIDLIRSEFSALKKSGLYYDCFICVKVSSEDGKGTTQDAITATKLYYDLKKDGRNPFFSEEEMKDRTGARYEALILYALYCADCMLVICSDESYLQSPWVKNEYTRYMKMLVDADKQRESITIAFKGTPIEKLPGLQGKIQGINLESYDGLSRVLKFVEKFASNKNVLPEIQRKNYDNKTVQKKESLKQEIEKRKIEIVKGGTVSVSDKMKLENAETFMSRHDFQRATKFCMEVIRDNPATGRAYWLLFLLENDCADAQAFINLSKKVKNYENLERAVATTEDKKQRKEYYNTLFERVKKQKDIFTYSEFVALPESEDKKIEELTEVMYGEALANKDSGIFDVIIKTVTNTDKYIDMNVGFARAISDSKAVEYFRNVLKVDEANQEALYKCFISDKKLNESNLLNYCADKANHSDIENGLFGYGYNAYAMDKLIAVCLNGAAEYAEASCNFFDFLLSMIPEKNDKMFKEYLNGFIDELFKNGQFDYIAKYNNLLLSLDGYDDNAYFNRVKLKYKISNLYALIKVADKLLDDENYMNAYNAYASKNKAGNNLYLSLNDALNDLKTAITDEECVEFVIQKFNTINKEELLTCKTQIVSAIAKQGKAYFNEFLLECKAATLERVFELRTDVTGSPKLKQAQTFAASGNDLKLLGNINKIYNEQAQTAARRREEDKRKAASARRDTIENIICIALPILMLIEAFAVFVMSIIDFSMVDPNTGEGIGLPIIFSFGSMIIGIIAVVFIVLQYKDGSSGGREKASIVFTILITIALIVSLVTGSFLQLFS